MGVAGNRQRRLAHEKRTAVLLTAAYGHHQQAVRHAQQIPDDAQPTDPHLSRASFTFAAGLAGFRQTAQTIMDEATRVAGEQGRADALALVDAVEGDPNLVMADGGDYGNANAVDAAAADGPRRLTTVLLSRLGLGGYGLAARAAISAALGMILLASRQALIDAYRQAQADVFSRAENVEGWVWESALASNTCGFCYAMHGTWHPDTEDLISHLYCQCVQVPTSLSAAEYASADAVTGEQMFADLPTANQRSILGPARFVAYKAGLSLRAMAGDRGLRSLRDLRRTG